MKLTLYKLFILLSVLGPSTVTWATPPSTHYVFDEPPEDFRSKLNVGCCFMIWEDRVLFLKRIPSTTWGGTWGIPGGSLKKNEDFQSGTIREVYEETGIDLRNETVTHLGTVYIKDPQKDFIYSMYECRLKEQPPEVVICDEHTEYRWMTIQEALKEPLIPGEDECIYRCYTVEE